MNKKINYILIAIIFSVFQVAICKTVWQKIEYQQKDLIDLYFDNSSVKIDKDYIYYRTRAIFAGDDTVCWIKSDCNKHLTSILKCKAYSGGIEESFYDYKDSKKMRSFDSTSPMYLLHNRACQSYLDIQKDKPEIHQEYWKPYMLNLEKEIKSNWKPPRHNKSNLTIVGFRVEKDGGLKDLKIIKSSKKIDTDKSALKAVNKTAPFKPLPKEFKGQSIPIEFSFSYNVLEKPVIEEAIDLLEKCPLKTPYNTIKGENPSKKPIKIKFGNLEEFGNNYKDYDSLGWKSNNTLHIYINKKHANAPKEAIAALIAGRSVNIDGQDSINEEIYAWATEGYVWKYLVRNNKIEDLDIPLVSRELVIAKLMEKSKNGEALIKYINKNYQNLSQTSKGYNDKQFKEKFKELMDLYNKI